MTSYLIRLPWPEPALWQNKRGKLRDRIRATKNARNYAWAMAREACVATMPDAILEFSFHPPDERRRDAQNMPATQKAAIDGIALAMGCDDNGFRVRWPDQFSEPVKGGCVLVHIKPPVVSIPLRGKIG